MMLGAATAAQARLIVRCKACQHQVEPDPAEMAARCGAGSSVLDFARTASPFRWETFGKLPTCGKSASRRS
jgi:hypothetical protein